MFSTISLLLVFIVVNQSNGIRMRHPSAGSAECTLKHGNRLLKEGDKITVSDKLYKVEECQLQRAYQTCGTHLWFMINIVCEAIDKQKPRTSAIRIPSRRFAEEKLLSDACCDHACTVNEMTRYCPN